MWIVAGFIAILGLLGIMALMGLGYIETEPKPKDSMEEADE